MKFPNFFVRILRYRLLLFIYFSAAVGGFEELRGTVDKRQQPDRVPAKVETRFIPFPGFEIHIGSGASL